MFSSTLAFISVFWILYNDNIYPEHSLPVTFRTPSYCYILSTAFAVSGIFKKMNLLLQKANFHPHELRERKEKSGLYWTIDRKHRLGQVQTHRILLHQAKQEVHEADFRGIHEGPLSQLFSGGLAPVAAGTGSDDVRLQIHVLHFQQLQTSRRSMPGTL